MVTVIAVTFVSNKCTKSEDPVTYKSESDRDHCALFTRSGPWICPNENLLPENEETVTVVPRAGLAIVLKGRLGVSGRRRLLGLCRYGRPCGLVMDSGPRQAEPEAVSQPTLFHLHGFEVTARIADPELRFLWVAGVHSSKKRIPDRHLRRAMRRRLDAFLKERHDVHVRELALIISGQHCEIGWRHLQHVGDGAATATIHSVAGRAVAHTHLLAARWRCLIDWNSHLRTVLTRVSYANRHHYSHAGNKQRFHNCPRFWIRIASQRPNFPRKRRIADVRCRTRPQQLQAILIILGR